MFESTYHGLMKWYSAEIEKFGWMIIFAQSSENYKYINNKLSLYLESLNELKDSIKNKVDQVTEEDRKKDLLIIHNKLINFIPIAKETLLKISNQNGGAKKKMKPIKEIK